jgi:putative membrane protein
MDGMDGGMGGMDGTMMAGMVLCSLLVLALVVLAVVAVIWLVRHAGVADRRPGSAGSALELLERRYAAGEVDEEDYRHRRAALEEDRRR